MDRMESCPGQERCRRERIARFWRTACRPWFARRNLPYFVLLFLLAFLLTGEILKRRAPHPISPAPAGSGAGTEEATHSPIHLGQTPEEVAAAWEAMIAAHPAEAGEKADEKGGALVEPADFVLPCRGRLIRGLGWRRDDPGASWSYHRGVDLEVTPEAPVVAMAAGEVVEVGPHEEGGLAVLLDHGDGWRSLYGGLAGVSLSAGGRVAAGEAMGHPRGRLVHLEIERRGAPLDPLALLPGLG